MKIAIQPTQKQTRGLSLTPHLQQAIRLLEFSNVGLSKYLEDEVEQNPFLELKYSSNQIKKKPQPSKYKGSFKNLNVSIVGDILHSRVAKSIITSLKILGVNNINVIGPENLMPDNLKELKISYHNSLEGGIDQADVVIMLRLQKERMHEALISIEDYYKNFGLTKNKIATAKKDVIVMHPGPINRGVEIDSDVADGPNSVILDQVTAGISVRMAIMSLVLKNKCFKK